MNLQMALLFIPGLVIGLTFHEAAHALSAKWLGDRTAERMGRISLNPFRHLSLMGTLVLFFLGFGWGKPVIVNLYNFKKPKLYYLLSSIAGPIVNLIISAIALGLIYLRPPGLLEIICYSLFYVNAILAFVNLLPIPPLDGSKIWPCLIPGMRPTISAKWTRIWMLILVVLIISGKIELVIAPVFNFLSSLLPA